MTLQLKLFGRLDVTDSADARSVTLRPRAQRLLAYLLLHRHIRLAREHVAFALWPDNTQEEALGALRRALSELRAALPALEEGEWVTATRDDVCWVTAAPYTLDVAAFEAGIRQATPAALHDAVALYAGDLLADWDEEWIAPDRERLRQLQLSALDQLVAHHRALGEYEPAIGLARRAVALDPLAEGAHRDLMTLHHQAGDRAAALAAYDRLRALLQQELGVEPMPETQALHDAIARGAALPMSTTGAAGPATTSTHALPGPPRLIGREAELRRLGALWESAVAGRGSMVILRGEAGVGKSHLTLSLAEDVGQRGGLTLIGHSYRFERALPYQAITEMLRTAANLLHHASLAPAHRAALANLAPDAVGAAGQPLADAPSSELRTQLFEALLQAFLALTKSQPLLLLFEDVHNAAESTLDWLTYIAPRLGASRILVMVTCRTGDMDAGRALSRLERRFGQDGAVSTLSVEPLSREAIHALITQLSNLNATQAETSAECLFEDSGGNPFFLHELVRGLIEAGQIKVVDGQWTGPFIESPAGAKLELPASLRATIIARMSRLTETASAFLRVAAVAGKVFQFKIVRQAGGWSDALALDAIEDALAYGFVRPSEPGGHFAFTHHLVQEAIYADMTAPRRAYWHRQLAEAIRAAQPHDADALAHHYAQAGEAAQAAEYFCQMAQRARSMYAYADALRALEAASDALDHVRQDADAGAAMPAVEQRRAEVLLERAALVPVVGGSLEEHHHVLEAVERLLSRTPDAAMQANWCLRRAEFLSAAARYEQAAAAALEAHDCFLALGDRRSAAHSIQLVGECKITISQNRLGRQFLTQALTHYQAAGEASGESECLSDLAWCEMNQGEAESALASLAQAIALSERRNDKLGLARGHYMTAMAWNYLCDPGRLQVSAERSLSLCREIGPGLTVRPLQFIADAHRMRGDLDQAHALHEQVFNEAQALYDHWAEGWAAQALGRLALGRGDLIQAEARLLHAHRLRLESGELQNQISDLIWLGRLRLAQGQPRAALDYTSQAMTRLEPLLGEVWVWEMPDVFMAHAEALCANDDPVGAAAFIQRAHEALMRFAGGISDAQIRQGYLDDALNARVAAAWESADTQRLLAQRLPTFPTAVPDAQLIHRSALKGMPATEEATAIAATAQSYAPAARLTIAPKRTSDRQRSRTNNLPIQLTTFIGREREVETVKQLLQQRRLLTLIGPGGCGKTRLALQVAGEMASAMTGGAWLVELAHVLDPALVPQAVALSLGVQEQPGRAVLDTLTDHLQTRDLLLILDNCEHVLDASAQFAETLLRTCTSLRALATSREPLKVPGETVWPVPPLALAGEADSAPGDDIRPAEAMLLFVDRAASVLPAFELNRNNAATIAHICQRLDGIPLAIELAATRVRLLTVAEIAARLDDAFGLLAGGSQLTPMRHQTLRATMDWSYRLLSEHEQVLFRRVAAFAGGCSLDAIEQVCTDEGFEATDVLDVLSHLVDKSLVTADVLAEGKARYHMLTTIHQYAAMRLAASGEALRVQQRHGEYFTSLAEQAAARFTVGGDQKHWLDHVEAEQGNIRSALHTALTDRDGETAVRIVDALRYFWTIRGHFAEARQWLERTLDLLHESGTAGVARAKVLYALGNVYRARSDFGRAQQCFDECLALSQALNERTLTARTLNAMGFLAINQQDCDQAEPLLGQALLLFGALHDRTGAAFATLNQGKCAFNRNDYPRATECFDRALSEFRTLGNQYIAAFTLSDLGRVQFMTGDYSHAESSFEQSLTLSRELGSKAGEMTALLNLGYAAHVHMRYEHATALFSESLELSREIGARWGEALALTRLGQTARRRGQLADAVAQLEAGLTIARDIGDPWCIAECQDELAHVAVLQDRPAQAEDLLRLSLTSFSRQGDNEAVLWGLYSMAELASRRFDAECAARLLGAIEAGREQLGLPLSPLNRADHDATAADVRDRLGDAAFAARWAEGRGLALEHAVGLALAAH